MKIDSQVKKKKYGLFSMTFYVFALGMKKRPFLLPSLAFFFLFMGIATTGKTFLKQMLFEAVGDLAEGRTSASLVAGYGVIMALIPIFFAAMNAVSTWIDQTFYGVTRGYMGERLNEKAAKVDPLVNKAYVGLEAVGEVVCSILHIMMEQCVYLVSMILYLYLVKPQLLFAFLLSLIPTAVSASLRRRMHAAKEHKAAPYRRKYEYFNRCFCSREYVKETRLWRAEGFFKKLYYRNLSEYARLDWETHRKSTLIDLGLKILQMAGYVGTVILLFYYVFRGELGIGIFAAVFTSLDDLDGRVSALFGSEIGTINTRFGQAQNYFDFLQLPERAGQDRLPLRRERIELRDVSFTYPGSEKPALSHVDLTIQKGETIAIVGVNGSGKSTLTRLLTGLYLPTSGQILIDGKDVSEIAPQTLYEDVSAVFQRYQSYKMTVAENVQISETEKTAGPDGSESKLPRISGTESKLTRISGAGIGLAERQKDGADPSGMVRSDVEKALEEADFPLENDKLTEGLETMLGKDFGGIDLSGGQWQRLAIARGLYRAHDMIVLDEPTAAIDPLEEARIYHKFAEISRGKTALIVTHRLGSAQIADRIIVMDGGHIVDLGTHEELMQREGKYREMYLAQAKWYQ